MEIELRPYTPADSRTWDDFVASSRNATFLFRRGYMDYHADRFRDASLMAWKGGSLVALLPANVTPDGVLHSHQGLTYGGWILPPAHVDGAGVLDLFKALIEWMKQTGLRELDYKPLPWIYAASPSDEDEYALYRVGAEVSEVNLSSAAPLGEAPRFNTLRRRSLRKAWKLPYISEEPRDISAWMKMLEECLSERHGVRPVHSLEEMKLLKGRFPENIRIFEVRPVDGGAPLAGVCVYDTGRVVHLQYIATTEAGRQLNLLTPLIYRLMTEVFVDRKYLDFGISNEDHGRILNEGLLRQKFSYGATGVAYRRYRLEIN